ncbi:MAG TPA: hypothetical protein VHP58_01295 [Alphaproteobacteria bacterium]|nr:hypothetical protein [Alphaproteobacteria bacterium]
MTYNPNMTADTLPVLTWSNLVDKKARPVGMFQCMATGILWLWGEDEEG